jgi:electron transfer flavoprotein alpha subunit
VLIGENTSPLAEETIAHGADEVVLVDDPRLKEYSILPFASIIAQVAKTYNPEIALFAATTSGRELAPRLASRLKAGVTADCTALKIGAFTNKRMQSVFYPCLEAIRPTYGESKLATIMGFWCPQMATARPGTFEILKADPSRKGKITRFQPELKEKDFVVQILSTERKENKEQGLFTADIIVSGGLPCGELDNFENIQELVVCLQKNGIHAEWGASRQAVDHGFAPYGRQIGQTGKTVRPKIYIAVGISGKIQHVSGMKESGMIIAVNKDPHAPIFNYADYGIVGDYIKVIPDLIETVRRGFNFGITP